MSTVTLEDAGPQSEDLTTSNFYELNGDLEKVLLPGGSVIGYEYDRNGNIQAITNLATPASLPSLGTVNYA